MNLSTALDFMSLKNFYVHCTILLKSAILASNSSIDFNSASRFALTAKFSSMTITESKNESLKLFANATAILRRDESADSPN